MAKLREQHRRVANAVMRRLETTVDGLWDAITEPRMESLRGSHIAVQAVTVRVFEGEVLIDRIVRAVEAIFQVHINADALRYLAPGAVASRRHNTSHTLSVTEPFHCILEFQRGTRSGSNYHDTDAPAVTFEHYTLVSYDHPAWVAYYNAARDHLLQTDVRDLLRRCADKGAVRDVVSAILLSEGDSTLLYNPSDPVEDERRPRGIHFRGDNDG